MNCSQAKKPKKKQSHKPKAYQMVCMKPIYTYIKHVISKVLIFNMNLIWWREARFHLNALLTLEMEHYGQRSRVCGLYT